MYRLKHPLRMSCAATAPMRVLREMEHHVERPAVTQAAKDREPELEETPADLDLINFEERVRASLGKPQATLAAVVAEVLPKMAKERRYASIGQIAAYVAANAQPRGTRERPWVSASARLARSRNAPPAIRDASTQTFSVTAFATSPTLPAIAYQSERRRPAEDDFRNGHTTEHTAPARAILGELWVEPYVND